MDQPCVYMCPPSWVPLPPPAPSHPSGLSQCTGFECPVSCIELGLVICFTYGSTLISKLFFQINHPTLIFSHRVQKSALYICVSFAVSHIGSLLPSFYIPYICISILYWCFSFWLTSLCIIGFSFVRLIRTDSNALFLIAQ